VVSVKSAYRTSKGPPPAGAALDAVVAELAARQHGVVAFDQLRRLGVSRSGVNRRVAAGRLHRLYRGVYAVGHVALTTDGRRMAAVLACGPGAALSHRSAAELWGIWKGAAARWDVTTHQRGRKAPAGIRLHRVRTPLNAAVTSHNGIPVTTIPRTLLDLAEQVPQSVLERAVNEAEHLRLLDAKDLEGTLAAANGRKGMKKLAVAVQEPNPGITRSVLEERFADLIARSDLPAPSRNVHVHTPDRLVEVDVLWPDQKVIVELDGSVHRTRRGFEEDRKRDAALAGEGYVVVRLTWRRITRDPSAVLAELRRILASRADPTP
jgi:putative AbiEi antitoxin of type IV toxin-antitoxin system/uncharacterized protein DUF559